MAPARLYTAFQLAVFREGAAAGLTIRQAAYHAGINASYARELSRKHHIGWLAAKVVCHAGADERLRATIAALKRQILTQQLERLAANRRLFSQP